MNEYISREAVVRYLKGYSDKECNSNSPYGMITSSVLNKVERALSEMPAADVQPIKHGRWKETGSKFWSRSVKKCSLCGNLLDMYGVNAGRGDANYCPNCGARMDGDTVC